jgi:hypothetical protein
VAAAAEDHVLITGKRYCDCLDLLQRVVERDSTYDPK